MSQLLLFVLIFTFVIIKYIYTCIDLCCSVQSNKPKYYFGYIGSVLIWLTNLIWLVQLDI
jgi:hypothetical protein